MTADSQPWRLPRWVEHVAVVLLYAVVACVATWPLVRIMDHAVLGPPGDNLEYVWKMAWVQRAIIDLRMSPFFCPTVFYPYGYPVALSETTLANTLLGLPLTALWGEVVAYNLMMLLGFALSGYGVYLWARALGQSQGAAIVAGMALAYCPYRMSHLGAGHLPLMGTGYIALLFWSLERFSQRSSACRGLAMGLFYALTALSSWYYAVLVAPFAAAYLLWRMRPWRVTLQDAGTWRGLVLAWMLAAILVAPAAWPLVRLYESGDAGYSGSLAYIDQWSASPIDLVYPNAMHPVWGRALTEGYYQNINESLIYLGLVAGALACVGLIRSPKGSTGRLLAILAGVSAILACGTTLHFAGEPIYLPVSEAIEQVFSRGMYALTGRFALNKLDYGAMQRPGAIPIPLPTLALYLFLPAMDAMRVWSRFGLLTMLMVAVLAGYGLDSIMQRASFLQRTSPWAKVCHYLLAPLVALLILFDFAVLPYAYGYTMTDPQPVDRWLAEQTQPSPVIAYPLDKTWYGWMLYPEARHGQPLAYGYGTFVPGEYAASEATLRVWPSQEALDLLRDWGVRYVIVGRESYGASWREVQTGIDALDEVELVAEFADEPRYHGDRLLQYVPATADVPATELINGPYQGYLADRLSVYEIR